MQLTASPAPAGHADVAEALLVVLRGLSAARDLDDLQAVIRASVRRLIGADGVTFILREGDLCFYADEDAIAPLWKGHRFPMAACISGWTMLNRRPAVIEDVYADARIPVEAYRPTFVKSLAMVPVRRDDPLAAMGAYWASAHVVSEWELRTLETVADAAGIALVNVRALAELRAALDEAERANRAKDDLLSIVSHELRTPLNAILGWTQMLQSGALPASDTNRILGVVLRNARAQLRLVEDMLDVSRAARGRIVLAVQPVSPGDIVHAAVEEITPSAEAKNLSLTVTLERMGLMHADPDRLRQIVDHLLHNAVKFTPKKGRVDVAVRAVPGAVEIDVRDSGEGIEPDILPTIFDRFRQADFSSTRRHRGLGLGLSLVRHLVDLHGGTVSAESDGAGKGARFVVRLPA